MKKKKYSDEPIGKVKIIKDFLPKPKDLALKEDTIKVTLLLSKDSVQYFKKEAAKHDAPYQTMIRNLLDKYVDIYKNNNYSRENRKQH